MFQQISWAQRIRLLQVPWDFPKEWTSGACGALEGPPGAGSGPDGSWAPCAHSTVSSGQDRDRISGWGERRGHRRHWPNETRALTMKEMKEGVNEERSVQRPKKHTGWTHATSPHTATRMLALYYTCRSTEKLEKISALMTHEKRKSAPGFALTVFMQQGKTQIASDPIYITLHNFMITIRQRSSRPQLFRLSAARKDKMGNTLGKRLPTLLSKITRRGRWLVSASIRNIPSSPILLQNLTEFYQSPNNGWHRHARTISKNHWFQDPWLKSIQVT